MTVLIVDDSLMIRKKMQLMIEKIGYSVIMASDGIEAIQAYKDKRPDAVTMDLAMPLMNGLDALKYIMKIDPYAKVIMSTANNFSDLVLQCMKEGASGYILKPIRIGILRDAINKAINDVEIASKKHEDLLLENIE